MGLPRPTTELDQLKADLDEHGYCIVADALSPEEVTALRARITEQAAAERVRALDYHYQAEAEGDDVNQWVYQLINKGKEFQHLALPPTARAFPARSACRRPPALSRSVLNEPASSARGPRRVRRRGRSVLM